jgi:hypothetical protein
LTVVSPEYLLEAALSVGNRPVEYTAPRAGLLTVLTKFETCTVKIGKTMLGFPPITRKPIASGQYRVDIVCQNGINPPGQFVTINPNENAMVRIF